jgi:hypothetical protein
MTLLGNLWLLFMLAIPWMIGGFLVLCLLGWTFEKMQVAFSPFWLFLLLIYFLRV